MNIKQCANGHYFDADSSERCPSCGATQAEDMKTIVNSNALETKLTVSEYTQTTGATLPDIGIEDLLGGSFGNFEKTEKKDINSGANQVRCAKCMNCISPENKFCPFCGTEVEAESEDSLFLKSGAELKGRYSIGEVLGYGGFGVTYAGWDKTLDRKVAVKEYFPTEFSTRKPDRSYLSVFSGDKGDYFRKGLERYLGEARTIAKLEDIPRIVGVKDYFEENNTAYIVMKFVEGITLKEYLKINGTLSADDVISLFIPLIRSLGKVHSKNIVHRDISPDNIMINENGIELIDFGAARVVIKDDEKSLSIVLKHGYAPEEQYRKNGNQGPWTDVYAMCATMYKCITGVTPPRVFDRMVGDKLVPPSQLGVQISEDVEHAIIKGLSINANDRFQSMESLYTALSGENIHADAVVAAPSHESSTTKNTAVRDDTPTEIATPVSISSDDDKKEKSQKENKKNKSNTWLIIALVAVILVAGVVIGILLLRDKDTGGETGSSTTTTTAEATASVNGGNVAPTDVSGTDNSTSETSSQESSSSETTSTTTTTTTTTTTKGIVVPNANYNTAKLLYDGNGYVNGVQMTIHGTFDKISPDATVYVTVPCYTHYSEQYDDDGRRYRDVDLSEYNYWYFNLSDKTNELTFYQDYYDKYGETIPKLYYDNLDEPTTDEFGTVDVKMGADKCTVTVKFNGQYPAEPGNVDYVDISISEDALVNSSTGAGNKEWMVTEYK